VVPERGVVRFTEHSLQPSGDDEPSLLEGYIQAVRETLLGLELNTPAKR
jgi:hypothetical protein